MLSCCRPCLWEECACMVLLRRFYNIVKRRLHVWSRHNIFYQNRDNNTRNKLNQNLVFPITSFSCWVLGILCTDLFSFTADASRMADVSPPPPCPPPGNNTGRGKMRQKIICYITRLFPPPVFCCPWNRNRTNYSSQKCIFLCSEKITFLKFPVRSSKGAEGGGVCPHVLMSPIVVWRAAECWLLSVAWLGAVRVYHNRMSQPLSAKTVNEPLRNCHI